MTSPALQETTGKEEFMETPKQKMYSWEFINIDQERWLNPATIEGELWGDLEDYPGYSISSLGRVKSKHRKRFNDNFIINERILKHHISIYGYPDLTICNHHGKRTIQIHILVAKVFIPNPEKKPQINHKNGIKIDNRIENLEWCTNDENIAHAVKLKLFLRGEQNPNSKLNSKLVEQIRVLYSSNKFTQQDLSNRFNVARRTISHITCNESWRAIK